jgi:hypothetical protein
MELSPSHMHLFYLEGDNTEDEDEDTDHKEVVYLDEDKMAKTKEGAPAPCTQGKTTPPKKAQPAVIVSSIKKDMKAMSMTAAPSKFACFDFN